MPREREQRWPFGLLEGSREGARCLLGIRRPDHIESRNRAQCGDSLHRFMRGAILANTDRVVRENVDDRKPRKRGQTDRRTPVIAKDEERRSARPEDSIVGKSVENAAHGMLAYAKVKVATIAILCIEIPAILYVVERRPMQVGAARDDQRHRLRKRLQHIASGLARRNVCRGIELRNHRKQIGRLA